MYLKQSVDSQTDWSIEWNFNMESNCIAVKIIGQYAKYGERYGNIKLLCKWYEGKCLYQKSGKCDYCKKIMFLCLEHYLKSKREKIFKLK